MGKKDQNTPDNIIKFRKPLHFNIGVLLLVFVLFYLIFHFFTYITKKDVAIYEVSQGTLTVNNSYKALIIRDEEVVYASENGVVDHYLPEGRKAGLKSLILSVDPSGDTSKSLHDKAKNAKLSETAYKNANTIIDGFLEVYSEGDYNRVYSLEDDMTTVFTTVYGDTAQDLLGSGNIGPGFHAYYPDKPAVVSYMIDGMESVTLDSFGSKSFVESGSKMVNYFTETQTKAGAPLYKKINSEDWYLIIEVDRKTAQKLHEKDVVKIHFKEDDAYTYAYCDSAARDNKCYGVLKLNNAVVRYLSERYIHIELVMNEENGLKIPESAIITKDFCIVPEEYFIKPEDSSSPMLMVQGIDDEGKLMKKLITPIVYYHKDDAYYVDINELPDKCTIYPEGVTEPVICDEMETLQGVYNVNKGYAVFKVIDILYNNDDYAIIKAGTSYGLNLYDHILLDGTAAKQNEIIYK